MIRINRPMLFVGLGGTGCKVGVELEKRLRDELCGADGRQLIRDWAHRQQKPEPYQLPSCFQFVYVDYDEKDMKKVRNAIASGTHATVIDHTSHFVNNLVPADQDNSADISDTLRITLNDPDAISWLPDADTDPRVAPVTDGAGQFPTVGRAVLYEALRSRPHDVTGGLQQAVTNLLQSGQDVHDLGGIDVTKCDVFVVFSVAGGTGAGVFYDYLHLITDMIGAAASPRVYPIAMMPSAFEDTTAGGETAELNAGSALIDLFRLVDDQNSQMNTDVLGINGGLGGALSVKHPHNNEIAIRAGTVQTAFLFGRPRAGVPRQVLRRSMVSMIVSLIGEGPEAADAGAIDNMDWASKFVNDKAGRSAPSETGVGRKGVSTSSVASLTVPVAELTELVSARLLSEAVGHLRQAGGGATEQNSKGIHQFFVDSGLQPLIKREPPSLPSMDMSVVGHDSVMAALASRAADMDAQLVGSERQRETQVASLADNLDPGKAATLLLEQFDLFRLRRMTLGHGEDEQNVAGRLRRFTLGAAPPKGFEGQEFAHTAPTPGPFKRRHAVARLKIDDPAVVEYIDRLEAWYRWRGQQQWHDAWKRNDVVWEPHWKRFQAQLDSIVKAFFSYSDGKRKWFDERSAQLYAPRLGITYLLPPSEDGLEQFYRTVLHRFKDTLGLPTGADEGDILNKLVTNSRNADVGHGWPGIYRIGSVDGPAQAVDEALAIVKRAVSSLFRPEGTDEGELLPRLHDLLAKVAANSPGMGDDPNAKQLRGALKQLLPAAYAPEGSGSLRVLLTYPSSEPNAQIEQFLTEAISLPKDMAGRPTFNPSANEAVVVVLHRTSMGITEVPEVRRVIRSWSNKMTAGAASSHLSWRQRLGYRPDYLLTTHEDRVRILHRALVALWNGSDVDISGSLESPSEIVMKLGVKSSKGMALKLQAFGQLSSWANLLQEYESWLVADDDAARRHLASSFMRTSLTNPKSPPPPDPAFRTFVSLQAEQLKRIEELRQAERPNLPELGRHAEFWGAIVNGALDADFDNSTITPAPTLRTLILNYPPQSATP